MSTSSSPVLDLEAVDPATGEFFIAYFSAKSAHDAAAATAFFADDALTYTDAPLGWSVNGRAAIDSSFAGAMPNWGEGRSYPTAILGSIGDGDGSALVAFTNTPGIVGSERLHILAAVDVRANRIIRWVDYWDSSGMDQDFRAQVRTPEEVFPVSFREQEVPALTTGAVGEVASALQAALGTGDAAAAAALFDDDATWDDRALRTRLVGRHAIERFLRDAASTSPFGTGSRLRHVVGHGTAGGVEWFGSAATGVPSGVTALILTGENRIATAATVYDGVLLGSDHRSALIEVATRP
jgi:ketosteroid isomerase-like protein